MGPICSTPKPARARAAQQRNVAGALGAEAEVITHQQPAHPAALHQHPLDELLGAERGEVAVEMLHEHALDAGLAQPLDLVSQVGDPRRGLLG